MKKTMMYRRTFCQASTAAIAVAATPGFAVGNDIGALSSDGQPVVLTQGAVADFRKSLRGPVLLRGDAGYDTVRRVWNSSIDRKPALIARCQGASDVVKAVKFGRAHGVLLAVRAGGHSSSGKGVCDDGLMLDLSLMRDVRVDATKRTAKVEGGALLGDLDRASQKLGLVTTAGTVSHTGVGGLTLGGGMGYLARKYGLTIDNLLAADVVTADAKLVRVSEHENADLFWGIRGGGGNFGIVTSFEFRLHEFGTHISVGSLVYPWPMARQVLGFLRDFGKTLSDDTTITPAVLVTPDGMRVLSLGVSQTGSVEEAEAAIAPLRKIAATVNDSRITSVPYLQMQTRFDHDSAQRVHGYLKSGFVAALTDEFNEALIACVDDSTAPVLQPIILPQVGGAISRIDARATAFPHRDAAYAVLFDLRWSDPKQSDPMVSWARSAWKRLEPFMRGVYVNFTSSEDAQSRVIEAYGVNYARMVELKKKYDPTNLFRLNVNVDPQA